MKPFSLDALLMWTKQGGTAFVQDHMDKQFPNPVDRYSEIDVSAHSWYLTKLEKDCFELELVASLATVRKIQGKLTSAKSGLLRADLTPLQIELQGRLYDELSSKIVWALSTKEYQLYIEPRNGWETIIGRFPNTAGDIVEAQRCFALSRCAGAVFHSVQVVEAGLIELGRLIGVTDPHSGWSAVANRLQKIIDTKHQERSPLEQEHFPFLEQIQGTIESLKNAWRNKVSHVHGKLILMTSDFSAEVAEEIIFATRAFMRRLATDGPLAISPAEGGASYCDENGGPKA
jgi:hypothetical protein